MQFSNSEYQHVQTVTFAGTTFALAQITSDSAGFGIEYTFIKSRDGDDEDAGGQSAQAGAGAEADESWTSPAPLEFPTQVRRVGMALMTEPVFDPDTGAPATSAVLGEPVGFTVAVENLNLWIFRTGADQKSILADRYQFDAVAGRLVRGSDIRFVYSGHADLPADDKDRYGATDPIGDDFVEPTFRIVVDAKLTKQPCAVVLAPDAGASRGARWQIFASQSETDCILRYAIPYTSRAAFDLTGVDEAVNAYLEVLHADAIGSADFVYTRPAATLYEQQELAFTAVGEPQMVQRSLRCLLVCQSTSRTDASAPPRLVCFDMALGVKGTAPVLGRNVSPQRIEDYQTALALDGRGDHVTMAEGGRLQLTDSGLFLSVWVKWSGPNPDRTPQTILSLNTPGGEGPSNIALCIDETGRLSIPGFNLTPMGRSEGQLAVIPDQWMNVGLALMPTETQTQTMTYVNGVAQSMGYNYTVLEGAQSLTLGQQMTNVSDPSTGFDCFGGLFGQVFAIYDYVDTSFLPNDWVYSSAPEDISPAPVLFWTFNEGQGAVIGNAASDGAAFAGQAQGATWVPSICPDQSTMPAIFVDADFLDVRAAFIDPVDAASDAPSLAPDTRVSLMRGADGFVHVYFLQSDGRAGALHMTTDTQRARFTVSRILVHDGVSEHVDVMALVARQAGTVWGQTDIEFGPVSGDVFETVTFTSRVFPAFSETWVNAPTRLDLFAQVINGQAAQPVEDDDGMGDVGAAFGQTQYDYIGGLTVRNPETGARLIIDGPTPSAFFDIVIPQDLLAQTPVPSLSGVSGSNITATVGNDPGWVMAPLAPSLLLSGTSGPNLQTGEAPELDIDGDLTLQCWINRTVDDSGAVLTYAGERASYQLALSATGEVTALRTGFNANEMGGVSRTTVAAPPLDEWAHLAAVYDSSFALHFLPGVYVKCPYSTEFDVAQAMTVEAWIKLDEDSIGRSAIVSRRSAEFDESAFELTIKSIDDDQRKLRLEVFMADGDRHYCEGDFDCPPNTWAHVAGVFHADQTVKYLSLQDDRHNFIKIGKPSQQPLTSFTVEMHINVRDSDKQSFVSFDRKSQGGANDTMNYFQIGYLNTASGSTQRLSVEVEDQQIDISTESWDPTDPQWRNLAVVLETVPNGSETYVTVYVDGALALLADGSGPADRVKAPSAFDPGDIGDFKQWNIGAEWDEGEDRGDYPDMDISEFRLWTTVRSQSEILNALGAPLLGDEPGLVRYITFDADKGSNVRNVVDQVSGESFKIHVHDEDDYDFDDEVVIWGALDIEGAARVFVNGACVHSRTLAGPNNTLQKTTTPLTMGRRAASHPGDDPRALAGSIDDVRVWNAARTAQQIDFFSQNRIEGVEKQPNLVSYWRFNHPRGATVQDIAGGHDGTVKGLEFAQASDQQALWEPSLFGADWTIYLDGKKVEMTPRKVTPQPNPPIEPTTRLNIGFGTTAFSNCVNAALSELQIWSQARSQADIVATRNQPADPSDDLRGYYRLNDGSGARATDYSGAGRDAAILYQHSGADPDDAWTAYGDGDIDAPVPVRDEAMAIVNATNGYAYADALDHDLTCAPSVVEDFGTGRRVYAFCEAGGQGDGGALALMAGVPLAETETVYLGQVQYKPQLVGYIEGAPPVPSENLTIDAPSNPDRYLNNSSTSLTRMANTTVGASAGMSIDASFSAKMSLGWDSETKIGTDYGSWGGIMPAGVGGGWQMNVASAKVDSKSSAEVKGEFSTDWSTGISGDTEVALAKGQTYAASLDGGWENNCYQIAGPVARPYDIAGKRLYRPNNMGSAMVKSRTADIFAVRSKRTKAMLGYSMSVNPEIPEDINIINFKLNPLYVRNGTLDGFIGFARDEYYLDLPNGKKGSYYKPEQAYRMKSTIERQTKKIAADLSRFQPVGGFSSYADQIGSLSLANTYVWTADAGTYSEEETGASSFSEAFSASGGGSVGLGGARGGMALAGWAILNGADRKLDVMGQLNLKVNYTANDRQSKALSLSSNVNSEGFLNRVASFPDFPAVLDNETATGVLDSGAIPLDTSDIVYEAFANEGVKLTVMNRVEVVEPDVKWRVVDLCCIYEITTSAGSDDFQFVYQPTGTADSQYAINFDYAAPPCPGKVRGYRFMSLLLAADTDNFEAFFATGQDQIIDKEWLKSDDPDAVALRQAKLRPNAVWRLLHRVTYVNRVPPQPEDWAERGAAAAAVAPLTQDVAAPPLRPDDHSIHHNFTLIDRVLARLAEEAGDPTWTELDLHKVELENVDMRVVIDELNQILDLLAFPEDDPARAAYLEDMTTFFELLFMPNERQAA